MQQTYTFATREAFRSWLTENHQQSEGIWLIFGKAGGVKTLSANDALEEALCFGWIDGQMQRIDQTKYQKYFKQRNEKSNWSAKNKKLFAALEAAGKMASKPLPVRMPRGWQIFSASPLIISWGGKMKCLPPKAQLVCVFR
ncbi:MAG: YdeI/OmpD-associated family protein [Christensenellaceae bacterium]|jgi:uncharacterized protein YdeI (YjbR/CyaY-like superfamily)